MNALLIFALFGFCYASDVATEVETQDAAKAVTQFSLDLLKKVSSSGKNEFFSAYSIAVAMGMVSLGAQGNTLHEIDSTFHFDKVNANDKLAIHKVFKSCIELYNQVNSNYTLSTANRLYGNTNFNIKQKFQDDIKKYYYGELQQLDFASGTAEKTINDWVAEQTHDKIKDLFHQNSLTTDTVLVLVNAIYFKGKWDKQFKKHDTATKTFHTTKTTEIDVEMMQQTSHFNFYDDLVLKVKVLELPYVGKDLSMFIFLPHEIDGLQEFIQALTAEKFESLISSVKDSNVQVQLPKFKLETEYSLIDTLQQLGVHDLFDSRCNVDDIFDSELPVEVSEVVHKAFVNVDEEGTEAAAATGIEMMIRSGISTEEEIFFTVDHPFYFTIRDKEFSISLFEGAVNEVPPFEESVEQVIENN